MRAAHIVAAAAAAVFAVGAQDPRSVRDDDTVFVRVPGTSNPYLAGMPAGAVSTSADSQADSAPAQSPVLVNVSLANAVSVTFSASGGVQNHAFNPPRYDLPNGSLQTS